MTRKELYAIYLKSPRWKELSDDAREAAGHRCQCCCSTEKLQAHHHTYPEHFGTEDISFLTVLCPNCHRAIHRSKPKIKQRPGKNMEWAFNPKPISRSLPIGPPDPLSEAKRIAKSAKKTRAKAKKKARQKAKLEMAREAKRKAEEKTKSRPEHERIMRLSNR